MVLTEHVTELIPGYALDCLDEKEMVEVSQHLAVCGVCRAEARAYQAVADQLSLASPQVRPPARVKQALMKQVQISSGEGSVPSQSWREQLFDIFRRIAPVWVPASLALILVLAASTLLLLRQANTTAQTTTLRVVNLRGTPAAPYATGMLVISINGEHGTLVVDDLPGLEDDQQYQLWLVNDYGQRTSGGVFSVHDGYASMWVNSPQPLESYPAFGVTIEPVGGSPAPTGERVLGNSF
jgi:anti-sigma-K factor RskA